MNFNDNQFNQPGPHGAVSHYSFMHKVYGWMCGGLGVTAAVSYYLSYLNPAMLGYFLSKGLPLLIVLFLAQIGLVVAISWNFQKWNYSTLAGMFLLYSALNGITLAPILLAYTGASVFFVFLTATVMFAAMALYGWMTKSDLSSMGNILFMGLIGLIVANLVNVFLQNSTMDLVISCVGVGVFSMLTAYKVQMFKHVSQQAASHPAQADRLAVYAALSLYLSLINLFLYLLRLFGRRRD